MLHKEEGRRKKEEGRRKKEEVIFLLSLSFKLSICPRLFLRLLSILELN
ncbi:hypothetical protein [Okeania sp. KiyG1]|nr:hypothetical protein [Okeania sp. KiyG1]